MTAKAATGEASARAALAGNPSDGYGGAVLALTLDQHSARVQARRAAALEVNPPSELVAATVRRFARDHDPAAEKTSVTWTTSIPRGLGLGGSSAIAVAVLKSLCSLYGIVLGNAQLAELALAVEVDELGITAGLQDRVVQAYGGLVFMDFDPAAGDRRYQPLAPALLPPLVVGWRADAPEESSAVHAPLRDRWTRGERAVVEALAELGALARAARDALLGHDRAAFAACVDRSYEARRRVLALDPRHVEMIDCARACGASANYAGSGGAIVAVCAGTDVDPESVARELRALGCGVIRV